MSLFKINQENTLAYFIKNRWIWHVVFWLFYFAVESPMYFTGNENFQYFKIAVIQDSAIILLTYCIVLILFPFLFDKKRYPLFLISVLINATFFAFIAAFFLVDVLNGYEDLYAIVQKSSLFDSFLNSISLYFLFSIFIVIAKIAKGMFIKQYLDAEKKKLQVQSELNNLKAQLSPHFLFNTMNNFYGLSVDKSDKLPDLMLRLSDLMRYSLYETKKETVSLKKEIEFIISYIELEKIRLEDTLEIQFNYNKTEFNNLEIAPLVLIVFVENAFKHARNSSDTVITINASFKITPDNWLFFEIENNFDSANNLETKSIGGIGLENVKKRLEVLYPDFKYSLKLVAENDVFKVALKMKLNPINH